MKTFALFLCLGACAIAAVDVEPFEQLIQQGKPEAAMELLGKELARHPDHPRLLYNYGVAAYAARRYDEALLAFDKVESGRNRGLVEKARKQKGNAEFHLGLSVRSSNLDETIERWKTSLTNYREVLKGTPTDPMTRNNHDIVEKLLMELLLKNAQQHLNQAHQTWMSGDQKIEQLHTAMEKFQEAQQVNAKNEEANRGEKQSREELARELAKEGERKARKPNQVSDWALKEMEKGVSQLEDAHQLLPEDKPIETKLDQAKQNLADALAQLGRRKLEQAEESNWDKDKFQKLDQAMEHAEQALDIKPEHQEAQKVLAEATKELARLHEEKGDQDVKDSERKPLRAMVQKLDSALEHYQEAAQLKPDDQVLPEKVEQTEAKLAEGLQKLADKMMQEVPKETLDDKASRLETAEQALEDLDQLKPSEKTEEQLADAKNQLQDVRQKMSDLARQPQKKDSKPQPPSKVSQVVQSEPAPDFEKMPEMKQQPLGKGDFKSDSMNKKGKDY